MVSHAEYIKWLGRPIDIKCKFRAMINIMEEIRDILNSDKSDGEKIKLINEISDYEYESHKTHYEFYDVSDLKSFKVNDNTD